MYWAGLQRRAGSAPLFLYPARHHLMVVGTRIQVLLQQSAKLRAQAASKLRARAAGPLCEAHERTAESDISPRHQVSWPNAPRTTFAAVSELRPTLTCSAVTKQRKRCSHGAVSPC